MTLLGNYSDHCLRTFNRLTYIIILLCDYIAYIRTGSEHDVTEDMQKENSGTTTQKHESVGFDLKQIF